MFSILHITDLHRSEDDRLSNAELISALVSDRDFYTHEDPAIAEPQAIVVSGDIIQGVGLDHPNFAQELADQYSVAHDFLADLTDRFLAGDRSKVVIVPGNHDIDWNTARASMEVVSEAKYPPALLRSLHEQDSLYRWDWKTRQLYCIKSAAAYRLRFAAFWQFFETFYAGVPEGRRPKTWSDANLYSLDEGRIGVAAFNSCAANDCFAFQGDIPRDVIARAHLALRNQGPWRLRIAVWHHDIEGPPHRSDYMDPDLVRGMIGRGFRLGLYGHQHRTQITPEHVYLPDRETMAVVSAGSLCAGARELPTGARRGYSIIEIGDEYDRARVHVREMAVANLFSRANLNIFGGKSFVDLEWTMPVDAGGRLEDPVHDKLSATLAEAEGLLQREDKPHEAVELLRKTGAASNPFGRRLMVAAAEALADPIAILDIVGTPSSIAELVLAVDAHLSLSDEKAAEAMLATHAAKVGLAGTVLKDLQDRIQLMQRIKR